jgi:hypothetical protein
MLPLKRSSWLICVCFITGQYLQALIFVDVPRLDTSGRKCFLKLVSDTNVSYVFVISNPLQETANGVPHLSTSARNEKILGAEWIPMIRGMKAMLKPTYNYFRFGRMNTIISLGNWDKLVPDQDNPDFEDIYFCSTRKTWSTSDYLEVYKEAL